MASTTITIPDAQVDRVAAAFGWPTAAIGAETKGAFIKRTMIEHIKHRVSAYESAKALSEIVAVTLDAT